MMTAIRVLLFCCPVFLGACASAEPAPGPVSVLDGGEGFDAETLMAQVDAELEVDPSSAAYTQGEGGEVLDAGLSMNAASGYEEAGSYPMSSEELAIWNSPRFKKRFLESYIASTDVEPNATSIEREQMAQILQNLAAGKKEKAIRLLEKYGTESASAVFDFTLASLYLEDDRAEDSIEHYRVAVRKHPNFSRAWRNLGLAHVRLGDFEKAAPAFGRVIELGGGDSLMYGFLGFANTNSGNHIAAETAYRMASLLEPKSLDWKLHLARCFFQQERFADAVSLSANLIEEHPDRADFWLLQASAYIGLGKPSQAAENYELVDGLGASTPESLNMLGDIYVNEELFAPAVDCYVRSIGLDPECELDRFIRAAKALTARGALEETNRLVAAIENARAGSLDEDEEKELLRLQARLALAEGAGDKEASILEKLVELDPLDGGAFILLGQHSTRAGDSERAIIYFERAAALEEFEAEAKVRHAQVLVGMSRYTEALPLLRRAQLLDPRDNVQAYLDQVERISKSR